MDETETASYQEKVTLHGMTKSRWRCPECGRALTDEGICLIDGEVEPVDLLNADEAMQQQAIELGLWKYFADHEDELPDVLTTKELAEKVGVDQGYLEWLLDEPSDIDDETWEDVFEDSYGVNIYTEEEYIEKTGMTREEEQKVIRQMQEEEQGETGWRHARQKKLTKEGGPEQTMFPGTSPKEKPRPPSSRKQNQMKQKSLEEHGAEIREPGQPKIHEFKEPGDVEDWEYYVENIRVNDFERYIDPMIEQEFPVSRDRLGRIWRDIRQHRDISIRMAKQEGEGDVFEAEKTWDTIEREFHRRLQLLAENTPRVDTIPLYTDYDARQIERYITDSGVEHPVEAATLSHGEGSWSPTGVAFGVSCDDYSLEACAYDVSRVHNCRDADIKKDMTGRPERVEMTCEVEGRDIPTELWLQKD